MPSKKSSTSGPQENDNTKIILAVIGLISAIGVAYLGYRQVTDPLRISANLTQTAITNNPIVSPTQTDTTIPTEIIVPTLEPSVAPTPEIILTPTPQPLISPECLFAEIWDYTPRKTIPTDGCWKVKEFIPTTNGIQMGIITVPNSGEQQRGFYVLLKGDADLQFIIKINAFESQTISPDKTKRSNIAFGIVEGSPFNYYNGIYVYYYASKAEAGRYDIQLTKEQDVSYNGALNTDREQKIRFLLQGNRLTVYIDDVAKNIYTLTFDQNAFYFGYRLFENTELSASVSNLTISSQK